MVRFSHSHSRLLQNQGGRTRLKPGWLVLVTLLVAINSYLLFVRGIPGGKKADPSVPPSLPPRAALPGSLGEMRGVAGVRTEEPGQMLPGPHLSSLRFNLAEARGVAGLRSLEQWCQVIPGTIEDDDTFAGALERHGVDAQRAFSLVTAMRSVFDFRTLRRGESFELLVSPTGDIQRFTYRKSPVTSYRVERTGGKLTARQVTQQTEVQVVPVAVRIRGSLYASLERAGESAALVMMIVDIFAWDIDFYIDTHQDDSIRLLLEKLYVKGEFVGYGRILAAEYQGAMIGTHLAFQYQTADQTLGYYDEEGGSLRKAFLKSPLKFTRISSGFGNRVHPILGFSQIHTGIDLAAPRGTPVWAPADGTVLFAGRQSGSGKLIKLRHANGYETSYAHLNTLTGGVAVGARVRQKQVIGTVGSTGLSTGPHLHYVMKKGGAAVNPFSQRFPPASPVPVGEIPAYRDTITPLLQRIREIRVPAPPQTAAVELERKDAG